MRKVKHQNQVKFVFETDILLWKGLNDFLETSQNVYGSGEKSRLDVYFCAALTKVGMVHPKKAKTIDLDLLCSSDLSDKLFKPTFILLTKTSCSFLLATFTDLLHDCWNSDENPVSDLLENAFYEINRLS